MQGTLYLRGLYLQILDLEEKKYVDVSAMCIIARETKCIQYDFGLCLLKVHTVLAQTRNIYLGRTNLCQASPFFLVSSFLQCKY